MDIREIARRAKVSTATVSRAINRVPTVDAQLAKRVWKVVDELGYYPNTQARALVSGRSRIFGLIVSEITNPFFPEIVQTFENLAVDNNYEILVTSTVHDPKRMESSVRRMIERRVDGVAILTFGMEDTLIDHLRFRKVPLVSSMWDRCTGIANIRINYRTESVRRYSIWRHSGIRASHLSPDRPSEVRHGQARRFQDVHDGNRAFFRLDRSWKSPDGRWDEGVLDFNRLSNRPTAVLCSNDMTAIGVMREAYNQNIKIPDDLSVVGFDDIRLAEFTIPPLTTVQMSQNELAKIAFQALLNEIESDRVLGTNATNTN